MHKAPTITREYRRNRLPPRKTRPRLPGPAEVIVVLLVFLSALALMSFPLVMSTMRVPAASLPALYEVGKGVSIYDRNDNYVATIYGDKDCKPVRLSKVSKSMTQAV